MKKFLLSFGLIVAFVFYILLSSTRNATTQVASISNKPTSVTIDPPINSIPTPATVVAKTSKFKDGTYSGPSVDAYFGNIQVSAVIQNGQLADVQFLQYPNDRGTSVRINTSAMPKLKSEAIKAQSAKVNGVSGATQTSQAFMSSLASALTLAAN